MLLSPMYTHFVLTLVVWCTCQGYVAGSVLTPSPVKSHIGREFVFGVIDVYNRSPNPLRAKIDVGATVGGHFVLFNSGYGHTYTYFVAPKSSISIYVDVDFNNGDTQADGGITITSNTDISVLLSVEQSVVGPMASYVIYPVSVAQYTSFIAASYKSSYKSEVLVTSLSDKTIVNVTDVDGTKMTTILDRLNTYQYTSSSDLTGCHITSSSPVVAFSGTSLSQLPQNDSFNLYYTPLAVQLLPSKSRHFIVPPVYPYEGLFVRVISDEPTTVTFTNTTTHKTMTSVGHQLFELGPQPVSVMTSVPVTLAQYNHPFMTLVPGVDQYLNSYAFVVPRIDSFQSDSYIVVIIHTSFDTGLRLDGMSFHGGSKKYIKDNYYTVITAQVTAGYHHMEHLNPTVKFGLLVYYKRDQDDSKGFGFFAGMDLSSVANTTSASTTVPATQPSGQSTADPTSNAGHARSSDKVTLTTGVLFALVYVLKIKLTD